MTTISLHPSIAGLIVTILNGLVEVICLWALYKILALYECRQWKMKNSVEIRRHRRYHKFLTALAFLMFIISETLVSINTDVVLHPKNETESCVKTEAKISSKGDNDRFGLAITYRCMQVKDDKFSFRTGEYNMETGAIRCDKEPVFKYRTNSTTKRSIRGAVTECDKTSCVSVFSRKIITKKNKVSAYVGLSAMYFVQSELDENREETFFNTEVFFDVGQPERIAREAVAIYLDSRTDELDIRRRTFLGAKNGTCEFCQTHMCQPSDAQWFYHL